MRVMYFAFDGFDNPNGTNHLAIRMIDYLLDEGINIHLLTSHTKGIDPDIPEILKNRKGFTYDIVDRNIVNKQNFIQRYLDGIKYAFDCKKKWILQRDTLDAVILQSTPTVFFSSILLKRHLKKPVIFNSYDVFPNVAWDTGVLKNKLLYKILLFLQKTVYTNAERILVISSDMRKNLMKQGVSEEKIVEVRNWYDDKSVKHIPNEENRFIQKYQIDTEKFNVQYAGNFGVTFNYKYVLDVAEKTKIHKNIRFQMIGNGAYELAFKQEAQDRKLDNIDFYPWQPAEMISDVYSSCDVSLIPLSTGVINNSFPSKGSILMACGKVILCATEKSSDYYKMIQDNKVGVCVSNSDPQEAAAVIAALSQNKDLCLEIGENAKKFGMECYSSSVNLPILKKVIEECTQTAR